MSRPDAKPRAMPVPDCRLYLFTPSLTAATLPAFAPRLAEALGAGDVASLLVRIAPDAAGDAKRIAEQLLTVAAPYEAAILLDGDPRLAARAGADGAHVSGTGEALSEALASLKPERIVGAGGLRGRDDAMAAGEAGADYVMFGEPRRDGFTPPLAETIERIEWWATIFETPCVGFAAKLDDLVALAAAGADFVALGDALWAAPSLAEAVAAAAAAAAQAAKARAEAAS
ncbi:MAG: thiamine phosphate synthase [Bradyrhizobium sp.]|nr:MAG: thiamine phosphate synthase [Bradyrhizobium sp.]